MSLLSILLSIKLGQGKTVKKVYSWQDDEFTFKEKKVDSNMAHLPLKKLLAFHYNQLSTAEKEDAQAHLDACDSCGKNLTLLVKPEQMLKTKPASTGTRVTEQSTCLPPEMIGKYINHELLPVEIPPIEKHLASCENCRHLFVAIAQCCNEPVSEEIRKNLARLPSRKTSEHVTAILRLMPKTIKPIKINPKGKSWLDMLFPGGRIPRPAYTLTTILLLGVIGKWWAWPEYHYIRFVSQSKAQLLTQHRIYYLNELRPAGDYRSSEQKQEMGVEEKPQTLEAVLQQTLAYKKNGEAGLINLAQYYLLEKYLAAADSVLKVLEMRVPQNAAVRNDRGYWLYQRGHYAAAAAAFAEAFALNPRLDEALYNLAITQTQLGDTATARASWEKYLALAHLKPEWRNAARAQLQALE